MKPKIITVDKDYILSTYKDTTFHILHHTKCLSNSVGASFVECMFDKKKDIYTDNCCGCNKVTPEEVRDKVKFLLNL